MTSNQNILEQIDVLHDIGRDFVERPHEHGSSVGYLFDRCEFDRWRQLVNDLLFMIRGCEDLYYQRFSKEVTSPHIRDLERGLRILSAVRDDESCSSYAREGAYEGPRSGCKSPSVGYH
jgi:hypothetical protein